jgi:hypothetical protein
VRLLSAGHTALYLVTMESEERGSGFFGRTTIQHAQHVQQLENDPVHAIKALLGRLQRSQGVPKMKMATGAATRPHSPPPPSDLHRAPRILELSFGRDWRIREDY